MTTASERPTQAPAASGEPRTRCAGCAAPLASDQRACVECGRVARPRYRRPPSWRGVFSLATVALIAAGVGVGFGIGALTESKHGTAAARTAPAQPAVTAPAAPAATAPGAVTPPRTVAPPATAPKPATPDTVIPVRPGAVTPAPSKHGRPGP